MSLLDGKIVCIGSINMDVVANVERLPALGETLHGESLNYYPGGKGANQAIAAAKAGAKVAMIGCVGNDGFGESLVSSLHEAGVNTDHVTHSDAPTGTAIIVVDAKANNSIVVIGGANLDCRAAPLERMTLSKRDVVVSQLEIPPSEVLAAFKMARQQFATTVLNPAPMQDKIDALLAHSSVVIVNEIELAQLTGRDVDHANDSDLANAMHSVKRNDNQTIVTTLGSQGVIADHHGQIIRIAGHTVDAVDTTGAGDCFVGNVCAGIANGRSVPESLATANLAAALSVQTPGAATSMPSVEELEAAQTAKLSA